MATHPQYSCLGNSMGRGAWWATIHRVAKSWTWLSDEAMQQPAEGQTVQSLGEQPKMSDKETWAWALLDCPVSGDGGLHGCTLVYHPDRHFIWEPPHSTTWENVLPELLMSLENSQNATTLQSTAYFSFHTCLPISQCFLGGVLESQEIDSLRYRPSGLLCQN